MTRFVLDTHRDGDQLVVVMSGEIDIASAPALLSAATAGMAQDGVTSLRLDMSDVTFLDSSGLGVLTNLHQDAVKREKTMIVWRPQPGPRRIIELAALHTLLVIEPGVG